MAAWNRATDLDGLVTHSDAGSQGSSHRLAGPNASPKFARSPVLGRRSMTLNLRRSAGSTGTTPGAFTGTAATCHPSPSPCATRRPVGARVGHRGALCTAKESWSTVHPTLRPTKAVV